MLMMRTVWFIKAHANVQLMLMMRKVRFDTSGTGRLMLVLFLAFKVQSKWQLMFMMRTVRFATLVSRHTEICS